MTHEVGNLCSGLTTSNFVTHITQNVEIARYTSLHVRNYNESVINGERTLSATLKTRGDRIGALMTLAGLNKKELAERVGKSRPCVSRWITENASVDSESLERLCGVLETSADYLLFGKESRNSKVVHINKTEEKQADKRPLYTWTEIADFENGIKQFESVRTKRIPTDFCSESGFWLYIDDPDFACLPGHVLLDPDAAVSSGSTCLVRLSDGLLRLKTIVDRYSEHMDKETGQPVTVLAKALVMLHEFEH